MQIVSFGDNFAWNVESYFLGKNEKNVINLSSSESAHSMVSVNFPLIETLGTVEFALMNRESPIQVLWNDRRIWGLLQGTRHKVNFLAFWHK